MGNRSTKEYDIIGTLGHGAFGEVLKVRDKKDNQILALKKIRVASKDQKQSAMKEAVMLHKLNHPHITRGFDFYEHSSWLPFSDKVIGIVMEFCDRGSLPAAMGKQRLSEQDILTIMAQVTDALCYLHGQGGVHWIMHRDLKLENILVQTDPQHPNDPNIAHHIVKVADLGLSTLLKGCDEDTCRLSNTIAGTRPYMAPEVKAGLPYGFAADVYSLGRMLGELVIWKRCWKVKDLSSEVKGRWATSRGLKRLCLAMLETEPDRRPTMATVRATVQSLQQRRTSLYDGRTYLLLGLVLFYLVLLMVYQLTW